MKEPKRERSLIGASSILKRCTSELMKISFHLNRVGNREDARKVIAAMREMSEIEQRLMIVSPRYYFISQAHRKFRLN